jgi:hypothetical protein
MFLLIAICSNAIAQIGIVWHTSPPVSDGFLWFLGSANMDADPGEELVYYNNDDPRRILILDGATGSVDWYSGDFNTVTIAGYNFSGNEGHGKNFGFSPFCDINGDGVKEITFWGRINAIDPFELFVVGVSGATSADDTMPELNEVPELGQNFPNPFNPTTTIKYSIPADGMVSLTIYDIRGRQVRTLINEYQKSGSNEIQWDGRDNKGASIASGTYFYQLSIDGKSQSKKMLVLK